MSGARKHHYTATIRWTGNRGEGTASYRGYGREHDILLDGKAPLPGGADPAFRGSRERLNPEEMLVCALSACHMLTYLHLCSVAGVVVTAYEDDASGIMVERGGDEAGRFVSATLRPRVRVADAAMAEQAMTLHDAAHDECFIGNSVSFDVTVLGEITVSDT